MKEKGLVQVYTGDGKGKTTAAIGLAARARGHNLKVCYIYFHKDPVKWNSGEHKILKKIGVDMFGFACEYPRFCKDVKKESIVRECSRAIKFIKKLYKEKRYDMLILDEINISVRDGYLSEEDVLGIIRGKPEELELVLTGRGATKKVIGRADLVSRIEKVKHPYDSGVRRKIGIEY